MTFARTFEQYILKPPYPLISVALFCFLIFDVAHHTDAPFWTHQLADPDDYMRLNQVINWLTGQGWYDLSQPRLSPGLHTIIHWSRLVDLPLAFFIVPLHVFFPLHVAALIASFAVPPILYLFLLMIIPRMARPLLGRRYENFALVLLVFAPTILFNFTPGRVDHHGYQILIAGFGFYGLCGMLLCRQGWRLGITTGLAFSAGLWIGTEIVPSLILTVGTLALFAAWRGGFALRNAAVFGLSLAVTALILLPIACPQSEWKSLAISWFSPAMVLFAVLTGLPLVVSFMVLRQQSRPVYRLVTMLGFSVLAALVFIALVPEALVGPFADYDPFNATVALDNIHEAMPLYKNFVLSRYNHLTYWSFAGSLLHDLVTPLVALAVSLVVAYHARSRQRMIGIIFAIFILATLLLAFFYQMRLTWFLNLYRLAPIAYLFLVIGRGLGGRWSYRRRIALGGIAFVVLGPVAIVLMASMFKYVIDPAADLDRATCQLDPAIKVLDDPMGLGATSHLILAPFDDGPALIFRTPHKVIGANFNVLGNKDVFDFYRSVSDRQALDIVHTWHVDYVMTCKTFPAFYAGREKIRFGQNTFLSTGRDGKLHLVSSLTQPTMIERLAAGQHPSWLKPVELPQNSDYLIYQVLPD